MKELIYLIDKYLCSTKSLNSFSKKSWVENFGKSFIVNRVKYDLYHMDKHDNIESLLLDIIDDTAEDLSISYNLSSKMLALHQIMYLTANEILMLYYELTDSPPDS